MQNLETPVQGTALSSELPLNCQAPNSCFFPKRYRLQTVAVTGHPAPGRGAVLTIRRPTVKHQNSSFSQHRKTQSKTKSPFKRDALLENHSPAVKRLIVSFLQCRNMPVRTDLPIYNIPSRRCPSVSVFERNPCWCGTLCRRCQRRNVRPVRERPFRLMPRSGQGLIRRFLLFIQTFVDAGIFAAKSRGLPYYILC